jgi:predicted metal-dependent peptidase
MQMTLFTIEPTDQARLDRFYQVLDQFDLCGELAKRVFHLGQPCFADAGSTASLVVSAEGKPLFLFNRRFFDSLGPHALAFVLLHEAAHWAFLHHLRRQERLPTVWNIAADLVVNQFLLRCVGFGKIADPDFLRFLDTAVLFENLNLCAPTQSARLTAEEAYDLLNKNLKHALGSAPRLAACDEHAWSLEEAEGSSQVEQIEELITQIQETFREFVPSWGDHALGDMRTIGGVVEPTRLNWDLVLSNRIASCIMLAFEQRWAPPNRKIAWLYPEVLLPSDQEIEKAQSYVLLAIDASGSISNTVLTRLLGLARGIPPDRVELAAISFDTTSYSLDIWAKDPQIRGGGGTSFDAIESFATKLPRYPDLIVVLTDGHAPRPTVRHPDLWFWLLTERGTPEKVEGIGCWCRISEIASDNPDDTAIPF